MSDKAQVLNAADLEKLSRELPDWSVRDGKLAREWTFPDFNEAMLFVNRVATVAERANHHPDIDVRYNRVLLGLVSHDAGGITARDAGMARELNEVVAI
jgi:4a-hydroxytetrahydrobiopterin dehydratase